MRKSLLAFLAITLSLAGCVTTPTGEDKAVLKEVSFSALPGWQNDNQAQAFAAFLKSCEKIQKKDPNAAIGFAGVAAVWQDACTKAGSAVPTDAEARMFFEENFTPYAVASAQKGADGLFTGYYEPQLRGSLTNKAPYIYPLYARPANMLTADLGAFDPALKGKTITGRADGEKFVPFYDRAAIEKGALDDQKAQIVWVDNAVDAFFLQIQGSGVVALDDGTQLQVGYAAQNGQPYLAIGKELIARGELQKDNVSMQSIRAWLESHPEQAAEVMNMNKSFVFFRKLDGAGAIGAQGVALTPGRSLAVDKKLIPYGLPLYLDAESPKKDGRFQRLMIAQDTGGAITGAVRGDVFWGAGAEATENAGLMKSEGRYYALVPKGITPSK